jgi:hypothetical protein
METPVAFLIFNRPELTRRVFTEIARAKPKRLLVIADGPRSASEAEKCQAARAVIDEVDWKCEVITNYSETNLGCKHRISSGLNWVFEQCEQAIILEDDCLPHPTFFHYCEELLDKYRDNRHIMMIGGSNFQSGRKQWPDSYYFSVYTQIWGWASWRRAWRCYDLDMGSWPSLRDTSWLLNILGNKDASRHWKAVLEKNYQGLIDSWDVQWMFSCWLENGLTALPNKNLISNIGFGEDATHTKTDIYAVAGLPVDAMVFPLEHPRIIEPDKEADRFTFNNLFAKEVDRPGLYKKLGRKVLGTLPNFVRQPIAVLRERLR